jgi:sulfatase maturation enzyme AslB (radical SAM superfamily)
MNSSPLCIAPWVHSFVHTSGERGLCCVSERISGGDGNFWNSDFVKDVRRKLLDGQLPAACCFCQFSPKPLYLDFNRKFGHLRDELVRVTQIDGQLNRGPVSFDHRSSYVCNFKCRMCNAEYSSSRKKEQIELQGIDSLKSWMRPENEEAIQKYHRDFTEEELLIAIRAGSVKEIYWAGGEPLLNPFHWQAMSLLIEQGMAAEVFISYNTNLSLLEFRGKNFLTDILQRLPRVQLMVSLDATGEIGEYIRTGLNWSQLLENLEKVLHHISHQRTLAISHCMTTPGIFDLPRFLEFANRMNLSIVSQMVEFGYESNWENPLSPLFFPKSIREPWINRTLEKISSKRRETNDSVFLLLEKIKNMDDLPLAKDREKNIGGTLRKIRQIEDFRGGNRLEDFLKEEPELFAWLKRFANWHKIKRNSLFS